MAYYNKKSLDYARGTPQPLLILWNVHNLRISYEFDIKKEDSETIVNSTSKNLLYGARDQNRITMSRAC